MPQEIAQQVVVGITLIGAVIWLFSLSFLIRTARLGHPVLEDGLFEPTQRNLLAGGAEVEGEATVLASKAATMLAKGTLGHLKIVEKTPDRLVIERLDSGIGRQPAGSWFRRAELRFTATRHNRSQVEWTVEPGNFRWLLWGGWAFQLLGLIALAAGCWAMFTFVASSPDPAFRWQSLQMLQAGHFLWPPFLFGGLYRKGMTGIRAEFDALANNLPYQA